MGDPPTFQFFFIIRQPSFEISIPSLPILRKNYRKILCTYNHVETPFCVMSRYQLGRDERHNLGTTWPQPWKPWNRPFYRYGGHIELIRYKEYYRMPRGHERISFVFSSVFRDISCSSRCRSVPRFLKRRLIPSAINPSPSPISS